MPTRRAAGGTIRALAEHHEVLLLDNTGVGLSTGEVPVTVTQMARDAIAFLDTLGLDGVDLLGFSLGGMVAPEIALLRPRAVRRLVPAGTWSPTAAAPSASSTCNASSAVPRTPSAPPVRTSPEPSTTRSSSGASQSPAT
ncbi:alpha/beta fold hydrolase [Monashia sp. NPDC004114]